MSEAQVFSIPKTMLILKSQATALGVIETFLRNRGWKIHSTANLKDALVQIVSQKPSYVLISVDHSNKKVRALPKLLASAFPMAIIVFAEAPSSMSYKILNESATEYRVYPPVTGPAIERCVNKYLKDQQTKLSVQENSAFKSGNVSSVHDTISIKGGDKDNISIKGASPDFGGDAASRMLSQFLGEEAGPANSSMVSNADSNLVFAQPLEEEAGNADQGQLLPPYLRATGEDPPQQNESNSFRQTYVQKGSAGNLGTCVPSSKNNKNNSHVENTSQPLNERGRTNWAPMEGNDHGQRLGERRALSDTSETLIARGAQKSLEESVEVRGDDIKNKLEETTSAACIVVESPRFSGYLVAAMGKNRKLDQLFIESIKAKLFKFLIENGEEVRESDTLDVKIKQVDFEPWALEYADFLRKSVHQGNEVAMAFFPRRPLKVIMEDSHHQDMAKIRLNELQGDRQIEFDLYVYLPNNDKFVLYTPKGGVFYNKQMDRLKKQGVTHMHVQKDAVLAISKYQAQNYLNDMIDDHEKKQEIMAKIKAS